MNPFNSLKSKPAPPVYLLFALTLSLLITFFGTLAFLQPETGRYLAPSAFAVIFYIMLSIGLGVALLFTLVFPKRSEYILEYTNARRARYWDILPVLASLCCAVADLITYSESKKTLTLLLIIAAFISALSYSANLIKWLQTLTLLFGYIRILFTAGIIAQLYLDINVEMNNPYKLLLQFALAAVMFGSLAEIAPMVGKRRYGRRFLFAQAAVILLAPITGIALALGSRIPALLNLNYLAYGLLAIVCIPRAISNLIHCELRELPQEKALEKADCRDDEEPPKDEESEQDPQ